jgi:hypothetical protein
MKWIVSRYNHDISYLPKYTDDAVIYDRSDSVPYAENAVIMPNIGADLYDKFTYIIDNYDNLPDVALYTKANIFKYITPEELDEIKDNTTFTPIFTKHHESKSIDLGDARDGLVDLIENSPIDQETKDLWYEVNMISPKDTGSDVRKFAFYDDNGMYNELNIAYYMPVYYGREKKDLLLGKEIKELLGTSKSTYVKFAPGSNYILPKENILKHPRSDYVRLRNYLAYGICPDGIRYPREAMVIERGLYAFWK